MGKSKRIRSDRARLMVDSPDKFEKVNSEKKAKITTIALIAVLAAIIIVFGTLIALDKTGVFLRSNVVFESDNYEINALMVSYMYYSAYNTYYDTYGSLTSYVINKEYITDQCSQILALCEAAKADGYEISEADRKNFDKSIETIKETVKESGYSLSTLYGKGVTMNDVKAVLELQTIATSYSTAHSDALTDNYLANPGEIDKYFEENKSSLLQGGYISANTNVVEWREKLAAAKTAEEFKTIFVGLYTKENFVKKYQSSEKEDADKVALSLLENLSKAAADAIDFVYNGTDVRDANGKPLELDDEATTVTEAMIKTIYEAKYSASYSPADGETGITTISDAIYKAAATAASSLLTSVKTELVEDTAHTYPNKTEVGKDDYNTTAGTTAEGETTTAGTTAGTTAAGTTAGATTTVDKTPATPEELNEFDTWFFSGDRKENEVYTADVNKIYFVSEPAVKNTELTVNVGHILVSAPAHDHGTEEVDADHKAEEEKADAEAKAEIERILAEFKAGTMNKDTFEALANKYTDDSGVFYDNVLRDAMVEEFNDWIYDEKRQEGDLEIVKTDYGYHLIYFLGKGLENWKATVLDQMVNEDMDLWLNGNDGTDGNAKVDGIMQRYAVKTNADGLAKIFG